MVFCVAADAAVERILATGGEILAFGGFSAVFEGDSAVALVLSFACGDASGAAPDKKNGLGFSCCCGSSSGAVPAADPIGGMRDQNVGAQGLIAQTPQPKNSDGRVG